MQKIPKLQLTGLLILGLLVPSLASGATRTEPLVRTVMSGKPTSQSTIPPGESSGASKSTPGWVPGVSYSTSEDGTGRYAEIDQTFRTVLAKPGKRFVKWFQFEDRFGVKSFYGSIALKARGSRGVTGILVKARGTGEEDMYQKIHKIREFKPGSEVLDYTSREGLRYRISVNPDSANGKTFDVRVTGKVRL